MYLKEECVSTWLAHLRWYFPDLWGRRDRRFFVCSQCDLVRQVQTRRSEASPVLHLEIYKTVLKKKYSLAPLAHRVRDWSQI